MKRFFFLLSGKSEGYLAELSTLLEKIRGTLTVHNWCGYAFFEYFFRTSSYDGFDDWTHRKNPPKTLQNQEGENAHPNRISKEAENRSSKAKDLSVFSPRMVALCHHHLQVLNKESFTIVGWRDTESKCFKSCIRVGSSVTRVIWLPVGGAGLLFSSFLWAPLLSSPSLFLKLCANYSQMISLLSKMVKYQPNR